MTTKVFKIDNEVSKLTMKWGSNRLLSNCTLTSLLKTRFFQNDVWKSESCKISQFSWTIREYYVRELGQDQAAMQVMSLTNSEQCSHVSQRRPWVLRLVDVSCCICYVENHGSTNQQKIRKVAVVFLHLGKRVMSIHFPMSGWSSPCWSPLQSSSRCADLKPCGLVLYSTKLSI